MDQNRVKEIVKEAKQDLHAGDENEIRARVQQAVRRREILARRIKSTRGDLSELEMEAQLLDKAIAKADDGDVSELPQLAIEAPQAPPPDPSTRAETKFVPLPPVIAHDLLSKLLATG